MVGRLCEVLFCPYPKAARAPLIHVVSYSLLCISHKVIRSLELAKTYIAIGVNLDLGWLHIYHDAHSSATSNFALASIPGPNHPHQSGQADQYRGLEIACSCLLHLLLYTRTSPFTNILFRLSATKHAHASPLIWSHHLFALHDT